MKDGAWVHPIVLESIPKDAPAYNEEVFGPVFGLFKASSDDECIEIANDTVYGLGASIFSNDVARAKQLALEIESGQVFINDITQSDPALPAGGIKDSGYGRECGREGMLEIANNKTVVVGKL